MTDRIKGFYVALSEDIREDDFQPIIEAVLMLKGVIEVEAFVTDGGDWIDRIRVKNELVQKLLEVLK